MSHDINRLVKGLLEDGVGCNMSEAISFYDSPFLVFPREDLWMPWDFKFDESRRVSCLAFDSFAYINAMRFFEMRSLSYNHMVEYTAENPEVIGLTVWFCLYNRTLESH